MRMAIWSIAFCEFISHESSLPSPNVHTVVLLVSFVACGFQDIFELIRHVESK
jgi:hypothetical protein